eukprot:TRINITY_DN319_c1_g1_i1.p1 TRINITY_DN319_c1_g1~~TRINITY_DN319_c1_g1_i1.p1  ORF type:complete len:368 (-),score=97.52 TRINITY_DN319_c1_g1_i1:237-1340(-)
MMSWLSIICTVFAVLAVLAIILVWFFKIVNFLFPANNQKPVNPKHLVVFSHGLFGSNSGTRFLLKLVGQLDSDAMVVNASSNTGSLFSYFSTTAGVKKCGTRFADEVRSIKDENPSLEEVSFIGHSCGGLWVRYALSLLLDENEEIYGMKARNLCLVASPFLGVRKGINEYFELAAKYLCGKTGKELLLLDGNDDNKPILVQMTEPESVFVKALEVFKEKFMFGNVNQDTKVPFATAMAVSRSTTGKTVATFQSNLWMMGSSKHIVSITQNNFLELEIMKAGNDVKIIYRQNDEFETEMITNLNKLSWTKVCVYFPEKLKMLSTHNTIVFSFPWESLGIDVAAGIAKAAVFGVGELAYAAEIPVPEE